MQGGGACAYNTRDPSATRPSLSPTIDLTAPPLLTRAFLTLIVAQLLQSVGYASMILLPLLLAHLGADRAAIGTLMGLGAVGGLLVRPAVAWALDAWGRKRTLFAGTVFLCIGVGSLGLVRDLGVLLVASRLVTGVGIGVLFSGYFTFASDHIPPARRTEGLALFGIFGLLGLAVNPLVEALGVDGGDLGVVFPVVAVIIAISAIFLARVPERPRPTESAGSGFGAGAMLRALNAGRMWPVWVATVVFSSLVATFMAFATVAASANGVERPAMLWLAYAAGAVGVRVVGARVPDRVGPSNLVAPALGFYVVALLIAASGVSFGLAGLFAGLAHGYCFPVLSSQVVTRMPGAYTGSGLSAFTGLWDLSRLVLTPIFGVIADRYDDPTMFSAAAVFAVLGLVVWATLEAMLGGASRPSREEPA